MEEKNKFYLTASMEEVEPTEDLQKEVASVINLPDGADKQPDLSYFSSIFVSSGENLNHAFFLGSELVDAKDSIVSKALDIEHDEKKIIGHIYSSEFTDLDGNKLNIEELASTETATLDTQDMHIQIGSIVYKNRFQEIAKKIQKKKYCVSMECYYSDFDIKVGDVIIPKEDANALGIEISDNSIFGKKAKVMKAGKEIAEGTIARVLRGICFSGCGIVKNPANPSSVILETAKSEKDSSDIVFDLDLINLNTTVGEEKIIASEKEIINVTSKVIVDTKEEAELVFNDTTGICVSYKKRLEDKDGNLIGENWCTSFEQKCTATFVGDSTDQECLRNKAKCIAALCAKTLFEGKRLDDITDESLKRLQIALEKACIAIK